MESKFNPDIYMVKGLTEDDVAIEGFIMMRYGTIPCISQFGLDEPDAHVRWYEVNPYSLCRNTGIMQGDEYLYESDLIEYQEPMGGTCMGMVVFDDFSNSWRVRTSIDFSGTRELKRCTKIKKVGNYVLSGTDADKFQRYSDEQDGKHAPNQEPECRSTQHINKLARQFLPR